MDTKGNSEKYLSEQQNAFDALHGRKIAEMAGLRDYLTSMIDPDTETEDDVMRRVEIYRNLARARRGDHAAKERLVDFAGDDDQMRDYIAKALVFSEGMLRKKRDAVPVPTIGDRNP